MGLTPHRGWSGLTPQRGWSGLTPHRGWERGAPVSFLKTIFDNFREQPNLAKVVEIHLTTPRGTDGRGMLDLIARARGFLASTGVEPGDRVASLAPNSVRWIAADLATLAEGAITVPMFDRAAPAELSSVLASAQPKVVVVATRELREVVLAAWSGRGEGVVATHDELFGHVPTQRADVHDWQPNETVAIIYTSGTSGEPKGVMLSAANLNFMIPRTLERLQRVVRPKSEPDRIFHFLPLCFAASRLMLWTQLSRPNPVMLSTDLTKMQAEFATAKPHYFLTVPMVLERIRTGTVEQIGKQGKVAPWLYERALSAHRAVRAGRGRFVDRATLAVAEMLLFRKVREKIGPNLEFVISGSAPLAEETQRWFQMLGIPIYQAYGLTETTGIVSLDEPLRVEAGRVGFPIEDVKTRVNPEGELLVAGPNVFQGYWRNAEATAAAMDGEWFRTGDQVDIKDGNLQIVGRLKNLLVPESGHNVAPEPLEEQFGGLCPSAKQCVIVGHGRPFLTVIATGNPSQAEVDLAIETFNEDQPYYKKIKGSIIVAEPLSPESGLLTANLKLRRAQIERHFKTQIDSVYEVYFARKKQRDVAPVSEP